MKRNIDIKEISDGKLYGPNDMVKADCRGCEGCSACCHGMGTSIVLTPLDIYRLEKELNASFGELMTKGVELNLADGVILPNLAMRGEKEACAFLNDSVRLHETQFTAHFAALGYRWDTFVDTKDLASLFVNPIMACPKLLADRGCPFFKRRSFFTPYADELRRTDGQAAAELYDYLKSETDYPVDDLLRALLPVQPLAAMAQNLHWHYILPQTAGECAPILLDANTLAKGCALQPDAVYCLPLPRAAGVEGYYYARSMPTSLQLAQAAELFDAHPLVGVLGPALPLYAGCAAEKARRWQQQKPAVQAKLSALDCPLPLDETPPPLPNGGCLLVRGAAFPQGLPPLQTESDFWLVPLLAQYNGYASATFETAAQCAARADVLDAALAAQRGVGPVFRLMGRTVKNALRKRKESAR